MSTAGGYTRAKQPERVRRALLDEAARLAVEQGLAAVTVQAVADAAGVTKGGFIHHFPSKQALIDAVFAELLDMIDRELDERIAADPEPNGAFTRAYVEAVFHIGTDAAGSPWAPLSISMLTDAGLRALWARWLGARLERHKATDGGLDLAVVRLAADGVWLADMSGIPSGNDVQLRDHLLLATRRPRRTTG
ncbi:TetR/AcrR family transcriptional regulator [Mesorhizobium shangrilense]|uniref:TetR/AcrR family transcriptional regulator n=1 Tax=Mesorhizobium shangrilense TaxID=460060 RepID=A0ABV2D6K0_9HYPH